MDKKVLPVPGITSTENVFGMELLAEKVIDRRRTRARKAYGVTVLVLAVGIFSLSSPNPNIPEVITGFLKVVMLLACCALVADIFMKFPKLQATNYEWLLSSNCDELAELCERNPGLVPYRDQVRSLNRRFTFGEYTAMKSWVDEQREQAIKADEAARERVACQRLYGIAPD
ncbi:hypothetical protein G3A43_08335 [Paraburkholderia aspalathi]|nr:hypothetical protein [Paraburkholderia aspalathi]MBK3780264.1 hypothetical protein [Paraburkholderia aspalathi]